MVEDPGLGHRIGISESGAVSRGLAGAWMGARSVWSGPGLDFRDLLGDVGPFCGAPVLLLSSPHRHQPVHLHPAAVDGRYHSRRRHRVAGGEICAGRVEEWKGVGVGILSRQYAVLMLPTRGQECPRHTGFTAGSGLQWTRARPVSSSGPLLSWDV